MRAESSAHCSAFARVASNLALGTLPLALLAALYPGVSLRETGPGWVCVAITAVVAIVLGSSVEGRLAPVPQRYAAFRRCLSCLLLGSSLLAVPWNFQELPCFPWAIAVGFGSRWLLYGLESLDLRIADRGREPLPCLATRLRRIVTWVTGALIPILVISGLPGVPLLSLSFFLTLFAQWTAAGEQSHVSMVSSRAHGSDAPK
jgi:hypothetical protein